MIWIESARDAWTPCSVAQPEEEGVYLCDTGKGIFAILEYCEGWNCFRERSTGKISRENEMTDKVVAWMPLPEPYKGDKDGTISNG